MQKSGVFRKKKIYFSQVSNVTLRDSNLSLKAKGLYSLIQSYITIEDFTLYKTTLMKDCKEKEKAFEATWKELKDAGYLVQYKMQRENGTFYYEYELLDESNIELANKIHSKNNSSNHTPKKQGVDKAPGGKGGGYNNTNLNNTNLNNINISSSIEEKEEDKDLELLVKHCQETAYKLRKCDMKLLLNTYSLSDIIKAINTAISTDTFINNKVKSYKAYIITVLNDLKRTKTIVINTENNKENKKLKFDNFAQRNYDYESLEKQLLGWDNEDIES